jgi:predicted DNA-binding protein
VVKILKRGVVKLELNRKDSTNFTLRMPVEQRLELEKISKKENRTVTNLINMVLKNYIERYNGVKK